MNHIYAKLKFAASSIALIAMTLLLVAGRPAEPAEPAELAEPMEVNDRQLVEAVA